MSLAAALRRARQDMALSIYLPAGYPDARSCQAYFEAAMAGGADWIELGIPFSDPAADGPTIQAATARSLRQGYRVEDALALARRLRAAHDTPLVAMTYANVAYRRGWDGFASALADAGIEGAILPDVPLEESGPVRAALVDHGVAWVPLVAPTTSAARMRAIAQTATGFLYVVGNVGTTGQQGPGAMVEATLQRARQATDGPLAAGFGIASPADVQRVLQAGADAAIVGSHIVRLIQQGATPSQIEEAVRLLRT